MPHSTLLLINNRNCALLARDSHNELAHGQALNAAGIARVDDMPAGLFRHSATQLLLYLGVCLGQSVCVHLHHVGLAQCVHAEKYGALRVNLVAQSDGMAVDDKPV
jgi:hypothetical protein